MQACCCTSAALSPDSERATVHAGRPKGAAPLRPSQEVTVRPFVTHQLSSQKWKRPPLKADPSRRTAHVVHKRRGPRRNDFGCSFWSVGGSSCCCVPSRRGLLIARCYLSLRVGCFALGLPFSFLAYGPLHTEAPSRPERWRCHVLDTDLAQRCPLHDH